MEQDHANPGLWKPVPTMLPPHWVAYVDHLHRQESVSSAISPVYVLDVRYDAQRVGDQLRAWNVPWPAVMAGYLWECDAELIQRSGLVGIDEVVGCMKQASIYVRAIETEELVPLLNPPYEDLGALLLAVAVYLQTLKTMHVQNALRSRDFKKKETIKYIAFVLRNIFKRLGIWMLKREIEDLSEQLLAPHRYEVKHKELTAILQRDAALVKKAIQVLVDAYQEAAGGEILVEAVPCGIMGLKRRQQNQLIRSPQVPLTAFDLITFNVVVPMVRDCYTAFGVLSQLGQVPERVIEQLTNPKSNGSSNIFLMLRLPLPEQPQQAANLMNQPVYLCDLQIATYLMNAITWYGCLYPDCYPLYTAANQQEERDLPAISDLWSSREGKVFYSIQQELYKKNVLLNEEAPIIVYDGARNPIGLRKGATALDFAYAIDPNVGNRAVEAFVNSRKSPLYRELDAGDIVEIHTANNTQTQEDWLHHNYSRTPEARQAIYASLKKRNREHKGYHQLCDTLERNHFILSPETLEEEICLLIEQYNLGPYREYIRLLDTAQDLYYTPEWAAQQIIDQITERNELSVAEMSRLTWAPIVSEQTQVASNHKYRWRLCGTCRPRYPHAILGRLYRKAGHLIVHVENCPRVAGTDADYHLALTWQPQPPAFSVSFVMISLDRSGLVLDLTRLLRTQQCDLRSLHAEAIDGGQARISFKVEVHSSEEVFAILLAIKGKENGCRIEIDAATTPKRVLLHLRALYEEDTLWEAGPYDQAVRETVALLPARNVRLKNPFNIARPAAPKMFFGRSHEIARIQDALCGGDTGKAMVLYGPLRSGKSSICTNFVEHQMLFNRQARMPVWGVLHSLINAHWDNEESIFEELAERLAKKFTTQFQYDAPQWHALQEGDPQARFQRLIQDCIARVPHSRLVLVLDEFGGALQSFKNRTLAFRFFTFWRELIREIPQLSLLFVFPTSAYSHLSSAEFSNVFTFAESIPVTYLDDIGAQQLLVDPLHAQHVVVHPSAIAQARRFTGGSPYYMTMVGQQLVELLNRDVHRQLITDEQLHDVIEHIVHENTGNNFDFLKLELQNEKELRILRAIVELTRQIAQSKIQADAIANNLKCSIDETRQHLDRLRDGLILNESGAQTNPYYSFKIELVRRWLLCHRDFFTA